MRKVFRQALGVVRHASRFTLHDSILGGACPKCFSLATIRKSRSGAEKLASFLAR